MITTSLTWHLQEVPDASKMVNFPRLAYDLVCKRQREGLKLNNACIFSFPVSFTLTCGEQCM